MNRSLIGATLYKDFLGAIPRARLIMLRTTPRYMKCIASTGTSRMMSTPSNLVRTDSPFTPNLSDGGKSSCWANLTVCSCVRGSPGSLDGQTNFLVFLAFDCLPLLLDCCCSLYSMAFNVQYSQAKYEVCPWKFLMNARFGASHLKNVTRSPSLLKSAATSWRMSNESCFATMTFLRLRSLLVAEFWNTLHTAIGYTVRHDTNSTVNTSKDAFELFDCATPSVPRITCVSLQGWVWHLSWNWTTSAMGT